MLKYARKIKDKKRKRKLTIVPIRSTKVGDWEFSGLMPTGEPIWYNDIDDYTIIMHAN